MQFGFLSNSKEIKIEISNIIKKLTDVVTKYKEK